MPLVDEGVRCSFDDAEAVAFLHRIIGDGPAQTTYGVALCAGHLAQVQRHQTVLLGWALINTMTGRQEDAG